MRKPMRIGSRLAVLLAVAGLLCQPVFASEDSPLSPSLVLVLKLVSTDRVQPATGVVVSDDGNTLLLVVGSSQPFRGLAKTIEEAGIVKLIQAWIQEGFCFGRRTDSPTSEKLGEPTLYPSGFEPDELEG